MRSTSHYLIAVAIAAVLGLQVASQVVDTGGTFWPFMPYHMYSDVYEEGAAISFYELRVAPRDPGSADTTYTFEDAGLPEYKFAGLLRAAASGGDYLIGTGEDGAARYLTAMLTVSGRYRRAQLWELRYEVRAEGLYSRRPERTLVREWQLEARRSP